MERHKVNLLDLTGTVNSQEALIDVTTYKLVKSLRTRYTDALGVNISAYVLATAYDRAHYRIIFLARRPLEAVEMNVVDR